jgi:hypothetical protein
MANFAIVDNNKVVNVIVADSKEIAEQITGQEAVEIIDNILWVDWERVNGEWFPPRPPKPESEGNWEWNEIEQEWQD